MRLLAESGWDLFAGLDALAGFEFEFFGFLPGEAGDEVLFGCCHEGFEEVGDYAWPGSF
ncbi:hypothetical protein [Desulfosediminicola sp.]|uniref:hypothetical protein n=1 Tax=Desulfosediminicola sp. TaxID=2886825 RepID=UPI003AF29C3C